MVAKVITGKSIRGALSYNEDKVRSGMAVCFTANQFPMEASELNFHEKMNRFTKLLDLKPTVQTNTLHIILSFALGENLPDDKLKDICSRYMEKLGFGQQPYIGYRHLDTEHPHVHIVTTNITADRKAINLHNIGRTRSEDARKAVESEFNLTRAEGRQLTAGKTHDLKSIVRLALQYKYTSLAEFNLILGHFGATADRGREGTAMYSHRGLLYSMIDADGKRIGKAIKASRVSSRAMLPALEKAFAENQVARLPFKTPLRQSIDKAVAESATFDQLAKRLDDRRIKLVLRKNPQGAIYGVSLLDLMNRCVFKGSDLGRNYSAKSLQDRMLANAKAVKDGEKKVQPPLASPSPLRRPNSPVSPSAPLPRERTLQRAGPIAGNPPSPGQQEPAAKAQVASTSNSVDTGQGNSADRLFADLLAGTATGNPNQAAALGLNRRKKRKRKKRL